MKNLTTYKEHLDEYGYEEYRGNEYDDDDSIDSDGYWENFAKALGKGLRTKVEFISMDLEKNTRTIKLELKSGADIEIYHNWGYRGDGTPTKPATELRVYPHDEIKLGRFAIWDESVSYAEDIASVIKKYKLHK